LPPPWCQSRVPPGSAVARGHRVETAERDAGCGAEGCDLARVLIGEFRLELQGQGGLMGFPHVRWMPCWGERCAHGCVLPVLR
jgi:hypothetical protein